MYFRSKFFLDKVRKKYNGNSPYFYHLKLQGVKLNPFVYYLLPLVSVRITQSAENPIKIDEVC